ncbi:hypothetical protein [Aridibaculum aurantiacum]|uniref:hypothetical protein n=1 Tax=Aridibaculum aurantiacum TaxID=2810307 RepID=UPI001A964DC9|nr:hypothetical protein [Aridibaculum aurantiacum]
MPFIKPDFLSADFNGDNKEDVAVLVVHKSTSRKGILIIHNSTAEHFVMGAGKDFGNGGKDFSWLDKWALYKKKSADETIFDKVTGDIKGSRTIKLLRPGILIEDYEDGAAIAGGIIYWNGNKYKWIHQGE